MKEASKAVFLSYASQDAEAAKRICDALRSGGVEVWFDADGGLEHGDEWDAKIRKQIKECVLFIPVISANTQARHEGYFRIEWDLAAERARGIASGVAFILPVVIDATREPEALVPDRFRAVQWTRLLGGEVPPEVRAQFLKLWSHRTGVLRHQADSTEGWSALSPTRSPNDRVGDNAVHLQKSKRPLSVVAIAALFLLAAGAWFWSHEKAPVAETSPTAVVSTPLSESKKKARQAQQLLLTTEIGIGVLETAAILAAEAVALDKSDAEAWATASEVETAIIHYARDNSSERRENARTKSITALNLDPRSFEARRARAYFLVLEADRQGNRKSLDEAEPILRALRKERPRDDRTLLVLGRLLGLRGVDDDAAVVEAAAVFDEMALLPGRTATALSEKAWVLRGRHRLADQDAALDQSIAIEAFTGNVSLKTMLAMRWHGESDVALATLEKLPPSMLTDDRGLEIAVRVYTWRREPLKVLELMDRVPREWTSAGPRAGIRGDARALLGQPAAAQNEWRHALAIVEQRLSTQSNDPGLLRWQAYLHDALGEASAAGLTKLLLEELSQVDEKNLNRYDLRARLLSADEMLGRIESGARAGRSFFYSPASLRLDPAYDKVRGTPRFQAALALAEANFPAPPPKAAKSIAVLAFDDLSPAKDNESFADGISEELLNVLGKVPNLRVVGRTSSFYFKGKQVPMAEMAKQLNVAYFVEGSVRRMGDQVRITARLTKASDLSTVLLGNFNRDLKDIFTIQDEIAGLIAQNLSLKLGANFASAKPAVNPEAFSLYMQGRQAWNLRTKEGFDRAEDFFNRALTLDRTFSRAYSGLADVWILRGSQADNTIGAFGQRNSALFRQVVARINEALALDPNSAEAHTSLGIAYHQNWQPAEAERALRMAVSLNPNYATAHQMLSRLEANTGRMEEAVTEMKLAAQLDPLSSRIADNFGTVLWDAGRRAEALNAYSRALELNPGNRQALTIMATNLATLGRRDEALALLRSIPDPTGADFARSARAYAVLGMVAEAESALRQSDPDYLIDSASTQLTLERRAEALASLEPAQIDQDDIQFLLNSSSFDPIRGEPRFQQMLATLGLTEAHAGAQAWRATHPPDQTR